MQLLQRLLPLGDGVTDLKELRLWQMPAALTISQSLQGSFLWENFRCITDNLKSLL